jgi:ubiquinone/menaquinone biosynthesis C-methylase UbiE/DNA-binding transcriptional ArsR family regulator
MRARRYIFLFKSMNILTAPSILDRLSALGDETRTRILALLERSELTVGELCRVLQVAQPTVSRHLKTLASEGWVEARADGRNRHYRLATGLDDSARALWDIVRGEIVDAGVYAVDAERVRAVVDDRRLRSSVFFAESARRWDAVRAELFGSATGLAPLLGLLDPGWVVGDLGVGTGALAGHLAPFADRVIGVDRSAAMLDAAEARLAHVDNVELRVGELEALPIDDGELDLAIFALVLHYVVDPASAVAEAHRALGDGGRLVLLDMRPHGREREYAEEMGHLWAGFEPAQIEAWLAAAGFASIRVAPLPPDPEAKGPLLFLASARA